MMVLPIRLVVTLVLFCMVERMVFHGYWRTSCDDQVVRLLEEIRDIQKQKRGVQSSQAAFVGLVGLFIFLGGTSLVSLLSWFFHGTVRHEAPVTRCQASPYRTVGSSVIFNVNYYDVMNIPLCKDDLGMSAPQQSEGCWISN